MQRAIVPNSCIQNRKVLLTLALGATLSNNNNLLHIFYLVFSISILLFPVIQLVFTVGDITDFMKTPRVVDSLIKLALPIVYQHLIG